MHEVLSTIENKFIKKQIADIRVGDTVRVHQRIKEGKKERVQIFEGLVISYKRSSGNIAAMITVRKIASGVGVEKTWFVHSPNVVKIQVVKRSKVRRALLSYMRARSGKSARMAEKDFDRELANQSDGRTQEEIAIENQKAKEEADKKSVKASEDELNNADMSTDDLAKKENKEAYVADPENDGQSKPKNREEVVNEEGTDEAELPAEEVQEGIDKAES